MADYACLYSARASDLGGVSPARCFRPNADLMPHDHLFRYLEADGTDESSDAGDKRG